MNTAKQVDELIVNLKVQVISALISMSEACWQTALACIGWAYVYSAWEALCTPSERRYRFRLCPDKLSIKEKCKAFDNGNCDGCQWYPGGERTRCGDCRGFVKWIIQMITGFVLYGDTVSAQWNHKANWCVKGQFGVDPVPQNVLVNVFIKNGSGKWTHTGFYYNGSTCECSSGVQYFQTMKKNRWTHWAVAACFASGWQQSEQPTEPPKEPEKQPEKGLTVNKTIRKGDKGELVKYAQTLLMQKGFALPKYGADGDYGSETVNAVKAFQKANGLSADGVIGVKTWAKLLDDKTPKRVSVVIRDIGEELAKEIASKYGGEIIYGEA